MKLGPGTMGQIGIRQVSLLSDKPQDIMMGGQHVMAMNSWDIGQIVHAMEPERKLLMQMEL